MTLTSPQELPRVSRYPKWMPANGARARRKRGDAMRGTAISFLALGLLVAGAAIATASPHGGGGGSSNSISLVVLGRSDVRPSTTASQNTVHFGDNVTFDV